MRSCAVCVCLPMRNEQSAVICSDDRVLTGKEGSACEQHSTYRASKQGLEEAILRQGFSLQGRNAWLSPQLEHVLEEPG